MPAARRTIRVFVSSTFRDMEAEREELVKRTFPQLRKLCETRGVGFTDVDLRWGVTEEQTERGEILPICLAEIDRCRPYFIALLDKRYGCCSRQVRSRGNSVRYTPSETGPLIRSCAVDSGRWSSRAVRGQKLPRHDTIHHHGWPFCES